MGQKESLGVPGSGDGVGRSKGGSGKIMPGSSTKLSGGTKFFEGSAQNNPDPRKGVGKPAPHTKPPGFPAERRA
jgi:hypothetical protein